MLEPPVKALVKPCNNPVYLTSGTARAVEKAHRTDRVNLISCGKRLDTLVEWYSDRDTLLVNDNNI